MTDTVKIAGILPRILAKSIDFIIIIAIKEALPGAGFYLGAFYLLISDSFFDGSSIGKKLLQIKVDSGSKSRSTTVRNSIIRNSTLALAYLLWKIPLLGWIFFLSIIIIECVIMLGNSERMRIGDEIAQTKVVELKEEQIDNV